MKALKTVSAALALLMSVPLALACVDPILKTNTDPQVRLERYRQIKALLARRSAASTAVEIRGASRLRVSKEECFYYPNLVSQNDIPCLAPLIKAYERLPKSTRMIETVRNGKRVSLAATFIGSGHQPKILICLPGVMSDQTEYRFVVGILGKDYDFWMIDPPGCGKSDAPEPSALGPDGYSPQAMADRELQAIAVCLAQCPASTEVVLVAHSLGGLVALRAFADPDLRIVHKVVLNRIQGMILLAPSDVMMSQVNPELESRSELSGLIVNLGVGLGVLREKVAGFFVGSYYCSHCLAREDVDHAVEVIANPGTRHAFQAMLRQALPFDQKNHQPLFESMKVLESWYTNVTLPVHIIWGQCDQTLPVAMGYKLEKQLPNAKLVVIPDCKHAPNLECPVSCARLIHEATQLIAESRSLSRPLAALR